MWVTHIVHIYMLIYLLQYDVISFDEFRTLFNKSHINARLDVYVERELNGNGNVMNKRNILAYNLMNVLSENVMYVFYNFVWSFGV